MSYTLEELLEERAVRRKFGGAIKRLFTTPEERKSYNHWMEFFKAGKTHFERLTLAANQTGKTTAALYELSLHLTGIYPDWWEGHRFDGANSWWVGGVSQREVQETLQERLLGQVGEFGSGFIPKECLDFDSLRDVKKTNTPVGSFRVKHISGGWSTVTFKSYEQGREAWQAKPGTNILLDEEPPLAIYTEALMRAAVGDTRVCLTFTPLKGVSDTVMNFLGESDILHPTGPLTDSRYLIRATWDDTPHLTPEKKQALINSIPPFQRDARTKGIPTLGAGAIYPVSEETVFIIPFELPKHWKRSYGLDVGFNRTAAVWGAIDPESGVHYIYAEHYIGEQPPAVHAAAIKARGDWIPGVIDPASRGRTQDEGRRVFDIYVEHGLILDTADNAVEGRLWEILEAFQQGRLKIFTTCTHLLKEFRLYRRDEKGKVVKKEDHALDAMRYWWSSGRDVAKNEIEAKGQSLEMMSGVPTKGWRF